MTERRTRDLVRDALREHARDVREYVDVAQAAKERARRRRRERWTGSAAVAVLAVVGVSVAVSMLERDNRSSTRNAGPAVTSGTWTAVTPPLDLPAAVPWRIESYRGVELRVPPDWTWSGAPRQYRQAATFYGPPCTSGRVRTTVADGIGGVLPGYVGRPGMAAGAYACPDMPVRPVSFARIPYVWFDSPLPVGRRTLLDHNLQDRVFAQQTVEVNHQRVTVGDANPQQRAKILASITAAQVDSNGCAAVRGGERSHFLPGFDLSDIGGAEQASVCVYDPGSGSAGDSLVASEDISSAQAARAQASILATPHRFVAGSIPSCPGPGAVVVLRFRSPTRVSTVTAHITGGCSGTYTGGSLDQGFDKQNVAPWAVGSVRAYLLSVHPSFARFVR